jgi:uncharacterized protein (DUF1697 family)
MTSYAAFLRGINVGGNKKISMSSLRQALETLGFQNVKTLLASGNVLFEARVTDTRTLTQRIEEKVRQVFGHDVCVILRTRRALQRLLEADPFKKTKVTPQTRLFVTFLSDKPKTALKVPYQSPRKSFRIIRLIGGDLCSVLTLGPRWAENLREMDILEKEFGKKITTRTWNTVRKCAQG